MRLRLWRRPAPTPALPPEPPVGAMVQEVYGMGDVYRRSAAGWQMFNRRSGQWYSLLLTWEGMHSLGMEPYVVLDVTAPVCRVGVEDLL